MATTLEDTVLATLADLGARGETACPVCSAPELTPSGCRACGSALTA